MKTQTIIAVMMLAIVSAQAQTVVPRAKPVAVGETAPGFVLSDQNGNTVKLSDAREKAPVVLVFYRGYW
jgi:cytochrome oxidase Cu insertion factor (SCO1/SenC/PrrC family)